MGGNLSAMVKDKERVKVVDGTVHGKVEVEVREKLPRARDPRIFGMEILDESHLVLRIAFCWLSDGACRACSPAQYGNDNHWPLRRSCNMGNPRHDCDSSALRDLLCHAHRYTCRPIPDDIVPLASLFLLSLHLRSSSRRPHLCLRGKDG